MPDDLRAKYRRGTESHVGDRLCSVCQTRPEDKFAIVYNRETELWDLGPGICNECYDAEMDRYGAEVEEGDDEDAPSSTYLRETGMPIVGGGMAHVFCDGDARVKMEAESEWRHAPPLEETERTEQSLLAALLGEDSEEDEENGSTQ